MQQLLIYLISFISLFLAIFWIFTLFFEEDKIHQKPKAKRFPAVSVIIPAYNEAETIGATLRSLLKADYPKNRFEIIVVANNCSDNTAEEVRKVKSSKIKLLEVFWDKGAIINGKAHAQNIGLKHAKGELIVVMDADTIVQKDTLGLMAPYFEDAKLGLVASGVKIHEPRNFLEKLQWFEFLSITLLRRLMSSLSVLFVTPGAFNMYKKSAVEEVGGFDENTLTEDLDVAVHLLHDGYKVKSQLDAVVYAKAMRTPRAFHFQRVRWSRGFFAAMLKYRDMLFNPKYGMLGQFMMPMLFVIPWILIAVVSTVLYNILLNVYAGLLFILTVGRNIGIYIPPKLTIKKLFFSADVQIMLFTLIMAICGIFLLLKAHKHLKEKMRYPITALIFLTFYQFLLSAYWLIALCYELVGAKKIWRGAKRW